MDKGGWGGRCRQSTHGRETGTEVLSSMPLHDVRAASQPPGLVHAKRNSAMPAERTGAGALGAGAPGHSGVKAARVAQAWGAVPA